MVKTFEDFIKENPLEPFREVKVDKWTSFDDEILHATSIMMMDSRYIAIRYGDNGKPSDWFSFQENDRELLVWADNYQEAIVDYRTIKKLEKKVDEEEAEKIAEGIVQSLIRFRKSNWETGCAVSKTLHKRGYFDVICSLLGREIKYPQLSKETADKIKDVFWSHKISFYDDKSGSININLDKAECIQTNIINKGKEAIKITMGNDRDYYIYNDDSSPVYQVLYAIYNQKGYY